MKGGTDLIEHHLSHYRNVIFICQTRHEKVEIWHRAMDRYRVEGVHINGKINLIDFGSAWLRFIHLDGSNRTYEIIQSSQAVVICHPDLLFDHGEGDRIVDIIKHRNQQHGNSKPRTT